MSESDYKSAEAKLRTIAAKAYQDVGAEDLGAAAGAVTASSGRVVVTEAQSEQAKAARSDLERRAKERFSIAR